MTPEDAIKRLEFHAQPEQGSFLYMLRPYSGLRADVLADLHAALVAATPCFSNPELPTGLVSALWAISHYGRAWALMPDGMLRANQLINDADLATLESFLSDFDDAVARLLDGGGEDAFADWGKG